MTTFLDPPMWPCGHYDMSMGCHIRPEKCPTCFPVTEYPLYGEFTVHHHPECPASKESDELQAANRWIDDLRTHTKWPLTNNQFVETFSGRKWNLRDPPGPYQIPRESGVSTGRMSSKKPLKPMYPRELDEELCEGCARDLPVIRQNHLAVTDRKWLAYHIIPEEGSQYYCRRAYHRSGKGHKELFQQYQDKLEEVRKHAKEWKYWWMFGGKTKQHDPTILRRFEEAQRLGDYAEATNWSGKAHLKENPWASDNWSIALRSKIDAAKKAKAPDYTAWDPYGDWDP